MCYILPIMRTCTKCSETKPPDAFRKWHRVCKDCCDAYVKSWKKANPEKARAYEHAWRKANPEKMRASDKSWREVNRERENARQRAWVKANPEKTRARDAKQRAELTPPYVAYLLGIPVAQLTPELLELKRQQIETHRLAKQVKTHLKERRK